MGDKKLFDIDEFWKDLKLDKYGIEDIDEFQIDEIGKKNRGILRPRRVRGDGRQNRNAFP